MFFSTMLNGCSGNVANVADLKVPFLYPTKHIPVSDGPRTSLDAFRLRVHSVSTWSVSFWALGVVNSLRSAVHT